ncbi:MAG: hypothetical protein DRJ14_07280 [Acidobacteria bacterium]|nr:MAG: hypothetical protein DRJ14_07280 [Acidobacteriota bacterium]
MKIMSFSYNSLISLPSDTWRGAQWPVPGIQWEWLCYSSMKRKSAETKKKATRHLVKADQNPKFR